MLSYKHIKKYAANAGFDLCGVARARVLEEHRSRYEAGLVASSEGYLEYLSRSFERRLDPSGLLSDARTIVVCAVKYDGMAAKDGVAAFAQGEDYHVRVKRMLREILECLHLKCPELRAKVCCDTAPILEKAWAVEAGLGWQGRNSLLINPELGSFLNLGVLILDASCDYYDTPFSGSDCGNCRSCIVACPVGALGDMTLDTALCISARTVEHSRLHSDTPVEPIHGWVWGCDECQRACPKNKSPNIL